MLVVYAFAMVALIDSSIPFYICCITFVLMGVYVVYLVKIKKPYPLDESIIYRRGAWLIQQRNGVLKRYDHMQIRFDTTVYMFMVFFSQTEGKTVRIVFADQMHSEDYHMLRVLEKISFSSDV